MRFDFIKKQVGLKVALFASAALLFVIGLVLIAFTHLDIGFVSRANLFNLVVVFALFFLFFQFVLALLSVNIFVNRPLHKLVESMQRVTEGNLSSTCALSSEDELGDLAFDFNKMITSLHDLNENRKRMEQRLIKAEESLRYKSVLEDKAKIIERMNRELTDAFTDLSLLFTVSQSLNSVLEVEGLLSAVNRIFSERYKLDMFGLYLVSPDGQGLRLATRKGFGEGPEWEEVVVAMGEGLAGMIAKKKAPVYFDDIGKCSELLLSSHEVGLKGAVLSLPLKVREELIGVLTICRFEPGSFTPTDRQSLESIVSQIAIAYDRSKLYTKTRELAVRDELTGIYNRRHFQQVLGLELKRAERFKRHVSLLMIDVDHFKRFNDTHGHLKGDELLKSLTHLMEGHIREVDLLARFGGEEFVIMLPDTAMNEAAGVANKICELVKNHLEMEDGDEMEPALRRPGLTVSIGVSSYPECVNSQDDLVNTADMALYIAKKRGRDRVYCYQIESLALEEVAERLRLIR